jgi:hypothetical protein
MKERKKDMRRMYIAQVEVTDTDGRYTRFMNRGNFENTVEQAKENVKDVKRNYTTTGTWRIVEKMIDEATFTVEEKTIETFDYWTEVRRFEVAERDIRVLTEKLEEEEKHLARCKAEKAIATAKKEIEWIKKEIAEAEEVLKERK